MFVKTILILVSSCLLVAYELPKVELTQNDKPKIVMFTAKNVTVKDKPSYLIKWKTMNANSVMLTFVGKVEPSGSLIITEDEYNRGAITLTASSDKSSVVDNQTINKKKNVDTPVVIFKDNSDEDRAYYNTMPYRRPFIRPLDRRRRY